MSSTFRLFFAAGLLAAAQAPGLALTVGHPQGAVQLGQPLELQVPVGLDPGLNAADLCPQASARYGDRPATARLDVRAEPIGEGEARLRLRAQQTVDEPFVAVEVSVGCSQRLTRRFVVLADAPLAVRSSSPSSPARLASPAPAEPAAVRDAPAGEGQPVAAAPSAGSASAAYSGRAFAPATEFAASSGSRSASTSTYMPTAAATARPRIAVTVNQAVSARMPGPPGTEPARPGPATANANAPGSGSGSGSGPTPTPTPASAPGPESGLVAPPGAATDHLQRLEGQVLSLQASLQSSQAAAARLRTQLEATERRQDAGPWVEAALVAAVTGWGLSGLAWWRARRSQRASVPRKHWADRSSGLTPALAGAGPAADAPPGQEPRMQDPWSLRSQEVSDVRQEADFFVSLGEEERAIELLRAHLQSDAQVSPQVWLHLLRLLYRLGRQDDYQQARADFERWAEARPPGADERAHPQVQTQTQIHNPTSGLAPTSGQAHSHSVPHRSIGGARATRGLSAAQVDRGSGASLDIDLDRVLGQAVPARELDPLGDVTAVPSEALPDPVDKLSAGPVARRG